MDEVIEDASKKYQGLVPLVYDIEIMGLDEARPQDMPYAVYLKREADKVVNHQKFKRSLAMARLCDEVMMSCELRGYAVHRIWANKHQWAMRWKYKWLEIAEKFKDKEAK